MSNSTARMMITTRISSILEDDPFEDVGDDLAADCREEGLVPFLDASWVSMSMFRSYAEKAFFSKASVLFSAATEPVPKF
jgi:hypothetical protein